MSMRNGSSEYKGDAVHVPPSGMGSYQGRALVAGHHALRCDGSSQNSLCLRGHQQPGTRPVAYSLAVRLERWRYAAVPRSTDGKVWPSSFLTLKASHGPPCADASYLPLLPSLSLVAGAVVPSR